MGIGCSCFNNGNINQQEYQVPQVLKCQFLIQHPKKQNELLPPLKQIGEYDESLEHLDDILQEQNPNQSINCTATFRSATSHQNSMNQIPHPSQTTINQLKAYDQYNALQQQNQQITLKQQEILKIQQSNNNQIQQKQMDNRNNFKKRISRSFSGLGDLEKLMKEEELSQKSKKQQDSDTNTKKSILKNKNINQNKSKFNRGLSLKQKQPQYDDTLSQKSSKSHKKVSFDPKTYRQKNSHFFQ